MLRAAAVKIVISSGHPIVQLVPEIGVVERTLNNWISLWKEEHPVADAGDLGPVEWAKYKALQAEKEGRFSRKSQCLPRRETAIRDYFVLIQRAGGRLRNGIFFHPHFGHRVRGNRGLAWEGVRGDVPLAAGR